MLFVKPYTILELSYMLNANLILKTRKCFELIYGISDWFSGTSNTVVVLNNIYLLNYYKKLNSPIVAIKKEYLNYISFDCFIIKNPRLALSILFDICINKQKKSKKFIINTKKSFLNNNIISKNVYIKKNVILNENLYIGNNTVIEENCIIGKNCYIGPNVIIHSNTIVGNNSFIGANSTIASDGFGFVLNEYNRWKKIKHFGNVIIGNNVSIGCNTSIDRGVLNDTIINDGTIIDNNVQIGHNVFIGKNVVVAGCTGIGGSVYISNDCIIGGGVMISDHVYLSNKVYITGASSVTKSIKESGIYSSTFPVKLSTVWNKLLYYFFKLNKNISI